MKSLTIPSLPSCWPCFSLLSHSYPAVAQAPAPDPEPNIGSLLVSYNLSDLEPGVTNRLSGISLEADLKIPGTVLSVVGHVSDHGEVRFQGVGPRVTHDLGPLKLFGHYLFGNLSAGGVATCRTRREERRRDRDPHLQARSNPHRGRPRWHDSLFGGRARVPVLTLNKGETSCQQTKSSKW